MQVISSQRFSFSGFELDPTKRLLFKDGMTVALNSKTLDLLLVLITHRGEILSKDELLNKVWENQFVEENNLTVHISALRKALGEKKDANQFVVTVPRRGYRFVAPVEVLTDDDETIDDFFTASETTPRQFIEISAPPKIEKASPSALIKVLTAVCGAAILLTVISGGIYFGILSNSNPPVSFAEFSVRQLTTSGKVQLAALSPDGKVFAFVVNDLGIRSLRLGLTNGGREIELRPASDAVYSGLAFSPDSNQLYFSLRDEQNPNSALFKMPAFGGAAEKVKNEIDNFSLSPDGRQIAHGARRAAEKIDVLLISDLETAEQREIARFPVTQSFAFNSLSWSPDGKKLALSNVRAGNLESYEISVIDAASGKIERVNHPSWREISKTVWLKNGAGLLVTALGENAWASVPQYRVFQIDLPDGAAREITRDLSSYGAALDVSAAGDSLLTVEHRQMNNIWIAPSDNLGAARQLTFGSFGRYDGLWGMDWTPDGNLIFTVSDTNTQLISQMNLATGEAQSLTAPNAVDSCLSVTRDGRFVVFHSNRTSSDFDIWRMDANGTNPLQLTFGGKNYQPFVSGDGKFVYYKSWQNEIGELRRVSIDGGAPEILNDKETSWGSFAPDGKLFAAGLRTDKSRLTIFSAETHEVVKQFDLPKTGTLNMGTRWTPDNRAIIYRDTALGYWIQPIDGGEARRLENLPSEKLYNFAFSKDGKNFAFVRGQEIRNVILLKRR